MSPLVVARVGQFPEPGGVDVPEILPRSPEDRAPVFALGNAGLDPAHPTVLAARIARVDPAALQDFPRSAINRRARQRLHRAAHGIASVEHRPLVLHHLDSLQSEGVDRVVVLVGAGAERGVVEADAVDQGQVVIAGESADDRRSLAVGGLLDHHPGGLFKGFGKTADRPIPDRLRPDPFQMIGDLELALPGARRRDHQGIELEHGGSRIGIRAQGREPGRGEECMRIGISERRA